jgi:hypothetical protein
VILGGILGNAALCCVAEVLAPFGLLPRWLKWRRFSHDQRLGVSYADLRQV